ncbi:hypothetical protein FS842_005681 [Serendipita sp. 407]|nr:hypothetical protein FS842_005681 [Serendipita sp. 407]
MTHRHKNKFTQAELWDAARYTLRALEDIVAESFLVGGAALYLHGLQRDVGDLDFVALPCCEECIRCQHCIKRALVNEYPERFYLKDSVKPDAKYQILMYKVPLTGNSIKIDILTREDPGVEIPDELGIEHTVVPSDFPVAPLEFLLYHKLLGWQRRMRSRYPNYRETAMTKDKDDTYNLCSLLYDNGLRPMDVSFGSIDYRELLGKRADLFILKHGSEAEYHLALVELPCR